MRTAQETNSINRILKARGMPTLDQPGVIAALARQVQNHEHFMELLRACDPPLRRAAYEAMRPHLQFAAHPLEDYIIRAKAYAEAAELPVMDERGFLHPYQTPTIVTVEVPPVELWVQCGACQKEGIFLGANQGDAIYTMRSSGWAWDESAQQRHLCPECLEGLTDAMDPEAS